MSAATAIPRGRWRAFGVRRGVLFAIIAAGAWAVWYLGLGWSDLWPDANRWQIIGEFFAAAVSPALEYEHGVPEGTNPLLLKSAYAAFTTLVFAIAAASLSIVFGLILGFFGSTAWWADDPVGAAGPIRRALQKTVRPGLYVFTRILIALTRSTHELIWAVIFLAAMGLTNVTAVLAIVIPYSGTLAKVFSEMIDESPRQAAYAQRAAGARPTQIFIFGLFPRALPDLSAYAIYRFECALRSSAILGFFGITTLGYYIDSAFEVNHYREVWTYIYTLLVLVVIVDWWSGALRRRLVT